MVAHRHVSVAPNAGDSCSGEGLKGMRAGAGGRGPGAGPALLRLHVGMRSFFGQNQLQVGRGKVSDNESLWWSVRMILARFQGRSRA